MEFQSFEELESLLYELSKVPGYKPRKDERYNPDASPLITPATFQAGSTRANASVVSWTGWAAIDVDEYPLGGFDEAIAAFSGCRHVCYSSASSKKEHPKFRVVLPLTCSVPAET